KGVVDILAAEQTNEGDRWFEGTADAVRRTQKNLANVDYDYVLILSGDQLYQMDYEAMVNFHVNNGGEITIGTIPVTAKEAHAFGILKSNENNEIVSFIEKPSDDLLPDWTTEAPQNLARHVRNYFASMCTYVF